VKFSRGDKVEEVAFTEVTGEVVEIQQHIAALVEAVRSGRTPPASGVDGRWAVLLCLAAQRSVDEGRPVEIQAVANDKI
jgi:myo-inositol 2-dehydrogenase/D-chiro-inositol 1-dehydrogenase